MQLGAARLWCPTCQSIVDVDLEDYSIYSLTSDGRLHGLKQKGGTTLPQSARLVHRKGEPSVASTPRQIVQVAGSLRIDVTDGAGARAYSNSPHPNGGGSFTPDRLAVPMPLPRVHWHRYFGVLARTRSLTGDFHGNHERQVLADSASGGALAQ